MSTETVETAAQAGDRRGSAEAGPRREAVCAAVGREIDPEVIAIAKRRKFSDTYKLKILDEIDRNQLIGTPENRVLLFGVKGYIHPA